MKSSASLIFVLILISGIHSELIDKFTKLSYDEYRAEEYAKADLSKLTKYEINGHEIYCSPEEKGSDGFCNIIKVKSLPLKIDKEFLANFKKITFIRLVPKNMSNVVVTDDAFDDLKDMEFLVLRNIKVTKSMLKNLSNLKYLHCERCDFGGDINTMFEGLKFVEDLGIIDEIGNLPTLITEDFFKSLSNLKKLSFAESKVSEIRFVSLPKLATISLYKDKISNISSFCGFLPELTSLRIEGNGLETVNWECFKDMPKLERLALDDNDIKNLNVESITKNLKNLKEFTYSTKSYSDEQLSKFNAELKMALPDLMFAFETFK